MASNYLYLLKREWKSKQTEIQKTKEQMEYLPEKLMILEAELEELEEVMRAVSQLPRYSDKN